ncbi:sensor histidine kinase [Streptomyces laurentii]|uniref:Sensor histidine kinase n=1 Tax=Streptomyces laurentii TaxID=39478 RepID=A0A160P763_STRLU|nr:sensor histidine kinase [Streptomyces laurentii]
MVTDDNAASARAGAREPSKIQKKGPKGCPVIPGGRATTATAPRRVVGTSAYIQYADALATDDNAASARAGAREPSKIQKKGPGAWLRASRAAPPGDRPRTGSGR